MPRKGRRTISVSVALVGAAICMMFVFVGSAAAFSGEMQNEGSGLCLSSLGTTTDGTAAVQEPCNGGSNNQIWGATTEPLGGVQISTSNNWCLTNAQGGASNGNPQTMWPCGGLNYKNGYYASGGGPGGGFKLAADDSAFNPNGYCVTSDGNTGVGSPAVEAPCNYSANQYWSGPVPNGSGIVGTERTSKR